MNFAMIGITRAPQKATQQFRGAAGAGELS